MANFIDSATIPVAAPEKNKFDMGMQHITTSDFMALDCAYIKEVIPGEKIDINMETFARLNAMPVPGFGRAVIKKHKFFVPMRQIYAAFTDMMSDVLHTPSTFKENDTNIPSTIPTITNDALVKLFIGDIWSGDTASTVNFVDRHMVYSVQPTTESSADIALVTNYTGSTSSVAYFNMTETGRQIYKLLLALGYGIVWENCKDVVKKYNASYSLLPLLGYIKIWCDYFFPMQYSNASIYQQIMRLCKKDDGTPYVVNNEESIKFLREILKQVVYTQYDSSLIANAWDTPNQPSWENYSDDFRIKNIDTIGQIYGQQNNNVFSQNGVTNKFGNAVNNAGAVERYGKVDAPFLTLYVEGGTGSTTGNSVATGGISEYLLKSLKALSSFMKRNQLIGSRAYERMMARYGSPTPGEKINRVVFLGSETQAIQIGDVTSTSDTEQGKLADFAGKGVSYGTTHLEYDSDEFGYVYILTSIVPISQTYQGIDPIVMRGVDGRTSYYVPEFDSLGVEALPSSCVYLPQVWNGNWQNYNEQVWGFVPRYATLKAQLHDRLTGNFRCASLNGTNPTYPNVANGASSWHLMREFDDIDYGAGSAVTHSIDYMFGYTDNWQYKRIFYGGPISEYGKAPIINPDNFTMIHNFEVASYAPMKRLYDVIDELEVDAEHKHKNLKMQVGGVKVN